jgi:hypothetical protein
LNADSHGFFLVFILPSLPVFSVHNVLGPGLLESAYEGALVIELKSVQALTKVMEAQVINYLRLSKVPVGYLLNFRNTRVEWKRFVHQRE